MWRMLRPSALFIDGQFRHYYSAYSLQLWYYALNDSNRLQTTLSMSFDAIGLVHYFITALSYRSMTPTAPAAASEPTHFRA